VVGAWLSTGRKPKTTHPAEFGDVARGRRLGEADVHSRQAGAEAVDELDRGGARVAREVAHSGATMLCATIGAFLAVGSATVEVISSYWAWLESIEQLTTPFESRTHCTRESTL